MFEKSANAPIQSLTDLFKRLGSTQPAEGYINLYRGHSKESYVLEPYLFRKREYRRVEKNIFRELVSIQPNEFREDRSVFEQLARMQHYGLPTRLLDLTYNPLVALYFACQASEDNGELITFTLKNSDIKYFDSDTVSCVANLSSLTGRERNQIRKFKTTLELNASDVGERLLHFIKAEKPYFLPKIEISHLKSIFAVRPKQTNRRILAQQGAFFIFGLKSSLRDKNRHGIDIHRTKVPAEKKKPLLNELDKINVNPSMLFPEIESAAKYIMSKIPLNADEDEDAD